MTLTPKTHSKSFPTFESLPKYPSHETAFRAHVPSAAPLTRFFAGQMTCQGGTSNETLIFGSRGSINVNSRVFCRFSLSEQGISQNCPPGKSGTDEFSFADGKADTKLVNEELGRAKKEVPVSITHDIPSFLCKMFCFWAGSEDLVSFPRARFQFIGSLVATGLFASTAGRVIIPPFSKRAVSTAP